MSTIFIISLITVVAFLISWLFFRHQAPSFKLPTSVAYIAVLLFFGLFALDLSFDDMGLRHTIEGVLWSAGLITVAIVMILLISFIKPLRQYFEDGRTASLTKKALAYRVFVDIPIATVLFEEFLFRGVLFGFVQNNYTTLTAIIISSLFFGVWHIIPSLDFAKKNAKAPNTAYTIIATVIFTAVSGVGFALLRVVSESILAPIALHYAVNVASLVVSWLVGNKSKDDK